MLCTFSSAVDHVDEMPNGYWRWSPPIGPSRRRQLFSCVVLCSTLEVMEQDTNTVTALIIELPGSVVVIAVACTVRLVKSIADQRP